MQWWDGDTEPVFGDHGAVDGQDGYIYAFGQFGATMKLYLLRVPRTQALNLDAYEYWNGQAFTSKRLINPTEDMSVLDNTNQGSFFWSPHFNKWVSLSRSVCKSLLLFRCPSVEDRTDSMFAGDMVGITMRTADKLQGPWSNETTVFQAPVLVDGNMAYAPTHHPHFDDTGKSLIVSYTQDYNIQQAVRIIFN